MKSSQIASLNRSQPDFDFGPTFESLEGRMYLNADPGLVTPIGNQYFTTDGALTLALDGVDDDGDALTFTVSSDNPNLQVYIPTSNRYARMHFVDSTGQDMGDILVQLFDDRSKTATDRFVTLATKHVTGDPVTQYDGSITYTNVQVTDGTPFYTDVLVHRVIPGFMIQTGDAIKGDGTGGCPLGKFADDFDPSLSFVGAGVLAMANSGEDSNDSQFFITEGAAPWLNQGYYVFGQMINGKDALADIINLPRETVNNRPDNPPKLEKVDIVESPQDGTLTMQAIGDWAGDATVTLTISDGHGGTAEQEFKVTVLGVDDPGDVTLPADGTTTLPIHITGSGTDTVNITATSSNNLATVSISGVTSNPGTAGTSPSATLNINTPASYSGAFTVTVTVTKTGTGEPSATQTIHVFKSAASDLVVGESGVFPLNGNATDSVLVGNRLYAVSEKAGLEIFDIDPATHVPTWKGVYKTPAEAVSVKVVGDTAYVVDTENGLFSLNVSNPTNITKRDNLKLQGGTYEVVIKGNVAFLTNFNNGITTVDIRDPDHLKKLGSIDRMYAGWLPALHRWAYQTEFYGALSIAFKGNYAYVADYAGYYSTLVVLNVADPAHMTYVSSYSLSYSPVSLEVKGNNLYVAGSSGLRIFDITKSSRPTQIGSLSPAAILGRALVSTQYYTEPFMPQFTIVDQTLIVGTVEGATFVDISDPAHPSVTSKLPLTTPPSSDTTYEPNQNKIQTILGQKPSVVGDQIAMPLGQYGLVMLDASKLLNRVHVHKTQSFVDSHGVKVTISIRGNGSVLASTAGRGQGDISKLEILGADAKTVVTVTTKGGRTTIGEIVCKTSLGSLIAPTVDLAGDLTIGGSLAKLTLGDVSGGHTITIHSTSTNTTPLVVDPKVQLTMTLGRVAETKIDARDIPIKSLTVTDWQDNDATADTIAARWLTSLTTTGNRASTGVTAVAGDFMAGLTLSGVGLLPKQAALGRASVAGAISDSAWTITGPVTLIHAGSTASTWGLTLGGQKGLAALTTDRDLAGTIQAQWLGTIKSGASLTADLTTTGVDAAGTVSIGTIQAGSINGATVIAPGGINTVRAIEWLGGSLDAAWLKSLSTTGRKSTSTNGDFTADLTLNKSDAQTTKPVLGGLTAAGALDGTWDITGSAGAIKAGHTEDTWSADFQGTGNVASLTTKGDLSGNWISNTLKTISVAGSVRDMKLTLSRAVDINAPRMLTLGSLTVKGWIANSSIASSGSIGTVSALAMENASVFAGVTDTYDAQSDGVLDLPAPGTDTIVTQASIGKLTIKGSKVNKVYETSFINSNIAAGSLGAISLAYADFSDQSEIYGLASATHVDKLMYHDASGAYTWPAKPADIGNFTVRLP